MIENIVLDLDHTIIMSLTKKQMKQKHVHPNLKRHLFFPFVIFERPGLESFLKDISKYHISVWTAASKDYGKFIVENIIEPYIGKKVKLFYHYDHCIKSEKQKNKLKHLDVLYSLKSKSFTRTNTILIDDNPDILAQNSYVFQISKFNLDPYDSELNRMSQKIATTS